LITVTELGSEGSARDHATLTSPIFGKRSRPLPSTAKRALRVKRIDWVPLRRLNRGGPTRVPARSPLTEAKKFFQARSQSDNACWSTTAETSPSHERPGVRFASVISCFDKTAIVGYGSPSAWACFRAATASLNTTRAEPNARASETRCGTVGYSRNR
jgi:hypothetical protein